MRRILIYVAYDGTDYHGWQLQDNVKTIESELNAAINAITGEDIQVIGASRTDAGVHARGNRAVFDTSSAIPAENWPMALNSQLPEDIRVVSARETEPYWHPRKCATLKTYEYVLDCGRIADPIGARFAWHVPYKLDVDKMNEAAKVLLGEHDFTSFCSVKGTALSNVRTITDISVIKEESRVIQDNDRVVISVTGNGFLYNMVRIITGTLVEAGRGKKTAADIKEILDNKDRRRGAMTAPPQGLVLARIVDME
ncbi:MAG: tRNA pseudouridine(38-40) synthase TruA [Lachnospiraceae bacterium]|nr:tRNA pseudouridine(38-40) synthase TruA [Lachnospiraceae bacterium]